MDDFLDTLLFFLSAVAAGIVSGAVWLIIRSWRNARNVPTEGRKEQLLEMIQEWKDRGYNYSERLQLLERQGCRKDVADALLGEAERMQKTR